MLHLSHFRPNEKSLTAGQKIQGYFSRNPKVGDFKLEFDTNHLRLRNDEERIVVALKSKIVKQIDELGFCVAAVEEPWQVSYDQGNVVGKHLQRKMLI